MAMESKSASIDPVFGEAAETCPYNKAHIVSRERLGTHVLNCRRVYEEQRALRGDPIRTLVCQYNNSHEVIDREIIYHEANCGDRTKIRGYQLNIEPFIHRFGENAKTWFQYDLKDYRPDEEELNEIFGGLYLNHIIGSRIVEEATSIDDVKNGNPDEQEMKWRLLSKNRRDLKTAAENGRRANKQKGGL